MTALIIYLIKLSLSLSFVYAFYALLLKRITFYSWNRLFLLTFSLASFLFPLINTDPWFSTFDQPGNVAFQTIPPVNALVRHIENNSSIYMALLFAGAGMVIVFAKLLVQYLSFLRINKYAVLLHHSGNVRIYSTHSGGSFSMGNNIYLDTSAGHSPADIEKVLQHEMIHVKQKHWIDLLVGELLCVVNWFNPLAWMLRTAIRQNLEFIADSKVLQKGYDGKEYQYLLLRMSTTNHIGIAAHFSLSKLKNRIYMINKTKSSSLHLARFAMIFPLLLLLLFSFRTVNKAPIHGIAVASDTIPPVSPQPPVPPVPGQGVPPAPAPPAGPIAPPAPVPPVPPAKKRNNTSVALIAPFNL